MTRIETLGLACPDCRGEVDWDGPRGHCRHCGRVFRVLGDRLPDFVDAGESAAAAILDWPDRLVDRAESALPALIAGTTIDPDALADLGAMGVAGPDARPTTLGGGLAYHLEEYRRQEGGDWIASFLETTLLGPDTSLLDVGCGAGQTILLLGPYRPAERIGVDVDPEALAFGLRLAERRGQEVAFVRAMADRLPFPGGRFTHVVTRVALNYTHQGRALREIARVLRPGGFLYCRVEGPGYDLKLLRGARGWRQRIGCLRDLLCGMALDLIGWQPSPGRRFAGYRTFATARRLAKRLGGADCRTLRTIVTARSLGLPVGVELVARRRP